ncbi:hypothetical protein AYO47_05300 [Planctomyces sp. SCGC AG-212-M04]|nr:hypothetical protein AYO47_05300 [Planctomyces sp. SCGC AG-212-M04]
MKITRSAMPKSAAICDNLPISGVFTGSGSSDSPPTITSRARSELRRVKSAKPRITSSTPFRGTNNPAAAMHLNYEIEAAAAHRRLE